MVVEKRGRSVTGTVSVTNGCKSGNTSEMSETV